MINTKKAVNRIISILIVLSVVLPTMIFADEQIETEMSYENVLSHKYTLADGVEFYKDVIFDKQEGYQRTYRFEYTPTELNGVIFARGKDLYTRSYIENLAKMTDEQNGAVIGGMNADFFNMSTGVPLSAIIEDGILITSDGGYNCLAIKEDGSAFIDTPSIKISITKEDKKYDVWSLNKELVDWGLCLYNDKFDDTTNISVPAYEAVFYPYEQVLTVDEIAQVLEIEPEEVVAYDETENGTDTDTETENTDTSLNQVAEQSKNYESINDYLQGTYTHSDDENGSDQTENNDFVETNETNQTEIFINVYSQSDLETIDEYALDNEFTKVGDKYYKLQKANPVISQSEKIVVVQTRKDGVDGSLVIPEGSYVLAGHEDTFASSVKRFSVGDEAVLDITANESFVGIKTAIGCSHIIIKDGKAVPTDAFSHYKYKNPRTAVGITQEGRIILFAVDGRDSNLSGGMRIDELSNEMLRLGCVSAANLDGGGSTTVKALLPYFNSLDTVNKISQSSERKISNAILFTNKMPIVGTAAYSYLLDTYEYVMCDSSVYLGQEYFTDENYYPVGFSLPKAEQEQSQSETLTEFAEKETDKEQTIENDSVSVKTETLSEEENEDNIVPADENENNFEEVGEEIVEEDKVNVIYTVENGYIEDGRYYPDGYLGSVEINSNIDEHKNVARTLVSVDEVDEITITAPTLTLYQGQALQLAAFAKVNSFDVAATNESFDWDVNLNYGVVFEDGLFLATHSGENIEITAKRGDVSASVYVNVLKDPFDDISEHWSRENIIRLFDEGIVEGEIVEEKSVFNPNRTYSRNEFCTMFARVLGYTAVGVIPEQIKDRQELLYADSVNIPDWAFQSVSALVNGGYLEGFGVSTDDGVFFNGNEPVSRKDVISVIGRLCENAPEEFVLVASDISQDDENYELIRNACAAEIFRGYEDGSLRLDFGLTRAEGAAVFVRLMDYLELTYNN